MGTFSLVGLSCWEKERVLLREGRKRAEMWREASSSSFANHHPLQLNSRFLLSWPSYF